MKPDQPPQRLHPQELPQRLQPQPVDVPPTEPHLQPQEPPLPVLEPPTLPPVEPELPEQAAQSKQKQHLRLVLSLSPLTLPFCLQQGLQQDWPTKLGNVMLPHIHELHIRTYLQKKMSWVRRPMTSYDAMRALVRAQARGWFPAGTDASAPPAAPRTGGIFGSRSSCAASGYSFCKKSPR